MILFFCGAPKHGSHFQMLTVTSALEQLGIAYERAGEEVFHRHDLEAAAALLRRLEAQPDRLFVCKGHWGAPAERDLLMSFPDVRVFLIWRDPGDVLVSQYYYAMNTEGQSPRDIAEYYYRYGGRYIALRHARYRAVWDRAGDARVHHTDYAGLVTDFDATAGALLEAADVTGVDLTALRDAVSLETLRERHDDPEGRFFRRGAVGEHAELITEPALLDDLRYLARGPATRAPAHWLHELRALCAHPELGAYLLKVLRHRAGNALVRGRG